MKKNHITRTIIASAVLFSFNAAAATSYFEARNDAMGGTGVASSHYGVAPLANPALLTKHNSNDDFSLLLPSVGAQVADPDDVSNKADDVKDDWDLFDSAVDNQHGVQQAAANLKHRLQEFRNINADAQVGVSAVAAMANDTLPFALMVKSYGTVSVNGKVNDADLDYLDKVANGTITDVDKNALTSRAFGRAAVITDVGISFAKELETAGQKWSLGVTPKYQRVDLFNYNVTVRDYDKDDFDGDKYHNTKNGFNADIGAYTDLNDNWTVGLVAQNIIPRSIDTKVVNGFKETFKVRPQATAGVPDLHPSTVVALNRRSLQEVFSNDKFRVRRGREALSALMQNRLAVEDKFRSFRPADFADVFRRYPPSGRSPLREKMNGIALILTPDSFIKKEYVD